MLDCWGLLPVRSRIKLLGLPTTFRSAGRRFSNSTNQAFNRSLSKDVFERRTSTGSDAFSFLLYIDATKFVSLSIFNLVKTTCPKLLAKPLSINAKSPFPVDVGRSKMPSLKFPLACVHLKPNGRCCKSVKVQLLNREK